MGLCLMERPTFRPSQSVSCRGEAVSIRPVRSGGRGELQLAVGIYSETTAYEFILNQHSANFLAHALLSHLKPFHFLKSDGTPSIEAGNPRASS